MGWSALGNLSRKVILLLRRLFEARIYNDPVHSQILQDWPIFCAVDPKIKSPKSVGQWRPISVVSRVQKAHLKVVALLI